MRGALSLKELLLPHFFTDQLAQTIQRSVNASHTASGLGGSLLLLGEPEKTLYLQ
jgi:hypothetical protein